MVRIPAGRLFSAFSQNTVRLLLLFFDSGLFWSVFLLAFQVLDVSQGRLKSTWIRWQQLSFRKLQKQIHCLKKYFPNRVLNRKQDCTVVKSSELEPRSQKPWRQSSRLSAEPRGSALLLLSGWGKGHLFCCMLGCSKGQVSCGKVTAPHAEGTQEILTGAAWFWRSFFMSFVIFRWLYYPVKPMDRGPMGIHVFQGLGHNSAKCSM